MLARSPVSSDFKTSRSVHHCSRKAPGASRSGSELHALAATPLQRSSVRFTDETSAVQRRLIVVLAFVRSLGQLDFGARDFLVGYRPQQVRDAIEAPAPLVIGPHDVPGRVLAVSLLQHHVAGPGIVVPASVGLEVHRAQLPLPQRIVDSSAESSLLLLFSDLQPDFDQKYASVADVFLELQAELQETSMVLFGAKTHHIFDAGAVVPAAVKDHDLARCRKLLNVTLHEHLRFFAIRRRRKRHHSKHARAHSLSDGLDRSTLTGGIAPLEREDDPGPRGLDPILHMTKFNVKLVQFLFIVLG